MTTNSSILNQITAARGTRVQTREDDIITVGFTDLAFWIPAKQSWVSASINPDKFLVSMPVPDGDFSTAWDEFWGRWKIHTSRCFPGKFVKIETLNN